VVPALAVSFATRLDDEGKGEGERLGGIDVLESRFAFDVVLPKFSLDDAADGR
jgi:hypothetical protein